VQRLYDRLELAIRCPVSPRRQQNGSDTGQFEEWIGTRLAAQILGWSQRRVQRHRADLDGQLRGDRLVFPARAVRGYAEALQQRGFHA
jgi:hypothetical protein